MAIMSVLLMGVGIVFLVLFLVVFLRCRESEWRRMCQSTVRLNGKTVIITGGNAGLGKYTAIDLARRGARVIIACRNHLKAQNAIEEIKRISGSNNVFYRQLDLASLASVRTFAEQFLRDETQLDILINNAGIPIGRPNETTQEGHDIVFGTNHFGHFLLTILLLDRLKGSKQGRVINVSSNAHTLMSNMDMTSSKDSQGRTIYLKLRGYPCSKLANNLFTRELAHRLEGTPITAYAVSPGGVYTSLLETASSRRSYTTLMYKLMFPLCWLIFQSVEQGAQTSIYCAVEESITKYSGRYFNNCHLSTIDTDLAKDDGLAKKLWYISCDATGFKDF